MSGQKLQTHGSITTRVQRYIRNTGFPNLFLTINRLVPYHEPTGFPPRALEKYRRAARSVVFDFIHTLLSAVWGLKW